MPQNPHSSAALASVRDSASDLETGLSRLRPRLARVVADTAGDFLAANAVPGSPWMVPSRLPDLGLLHSSQRNLGEKLEMICNLSVEKSEWRRLVGAAGGEDISQDAFCELANCICGNLIADAAFADEFGYLLPCVPCAGRAAAAPGARAARGAFRVGGAWVHFSISVQAAAGSFSSQSILAA